MENSIKTQYQNTSNIAARIQLHNKYFVNKHGWFPWIYQQLEKYCQLDSEKKQILEIGCGSGALWHENIDKIRVSKALLQISHQHISQIQSVG